MNIYYGYKPKPTQKNQISQKNYAKFGKIFVVIVSILLFLSAGQMTFAQVFKPTKTQVVNASSQSSSIVKSVLGVQNTQNSSKNVSSFASDIQASSNSDSTNSSSSKSSSSTTIGKYKILSGLEFQHLYENIEYTKVDTLTTAPSITGNSEVDIYIRKKAEARGYMTRHQALENKLVKIDGQRLQEETKTAWLALKAQAAKENIKLTLVSGYRSISDQRSLFVTDLNKGKFTNKQILAGLADKTIDTILSSRSIPGYSRHHTGYAFDIGCGNTNLLDFKNTPCFTWMSKNNYENAKKFGLIPSYPDGAENQGPNPEEWEYVWIGTGELLN